MLPDVVERFRVTEGYPGVARSTKEIDNDWPAEQLARPGIVDQPLQLREMGCCRRDVVVV
jgi:hypothetical protein